MFLTVEIKHVLNPDKFLGPNHLRLFLVNKNFCDFLGASHSEAERIAELEKDVNTERLDKQRQEEAAKSLQERLDKVKSELDALRKDQVIKVSNRNSSGKLLYQWFSVY